VDPIPTTVKKCGLLYLFWDGIPTKRLEYFAPCYSHFYWQILKKIILFSGFKILNKNPWNKKYWVCSLIAFCRKEKWVLKTRQKLESENAVQEFHLWFHMPPCSPVACMHDPYMRPGVPIQPLFCVHPSCLAAIGQ
jgi:hypothetical protein